MIDVFRQKMIRYQDISPEKFTLLMKDQDHYVIDVRTEEEAEEGLIGKAVNINYFSRQFKDSIKKLDQSKTYLIYCRNGGRARKASKTMTDLGFEKVYYLQGGIKAWNKRKK